MTALARNQPVNDGTVVQKLYATPSIIGAVILMELGLGQIIVMLWYHSIEESKYKTKLIQASVLP